jgi:hypothetical protein
MKRVLFGGAAVLAAFTLLVQSAAAQRQPGSMTVQSRGGWTRTTPRLPSDVPAVPNGNRIVYVVTNGLQFGAEDLRSGAFVPIGPGLPPEDAGVGLVPGHGRSLLTLAFTGDLIGVDPVTGAASLVGKTGLGDCSTPTSPCGLNSAGFLGNLGGNLYATDFANNLYSVDSTTGAASLIGPTGIPAITANPNIPNSDGSFNVFDANLFSFRGKLYTIFDGFTINPVTGAVAPIVPGAIYEIDAKTGQATRIASTALGLTSVVTVSDTVYGFDALTGQIITVDMTSGQTNAVSEIDPAIIIAVCGATPAPGAQGNGR